MRKHSIAELFSFTPALFSRFYPNKFMKKLIVLSIVLCTANLTLVFGQSLETGIRFYEEGNYERALRVFEEIDDPEAILFAGKSHYALNNFLKAKQYLSRIRESSDKLILDEANYTAALADFQLKNFSAALDALYKLNESSPSATVSREAYSFYNSLIDYLTLEQRHNAFNATKYNEVRFDLIEAAMGKIDWASANVLFNKYKNSVVDVDTSAYRSLSTLLKDSVAYAQRYMPDRYAKAPKGIAYNIGVALPSFEVDAPQYEISQHLYFGIQLAVENFNSENTDYKAFISYRDTKMDPSKAAEIMTDLVWNHGADVVIGPLFSEMAQEMSTLAERYEIPMLTPLANSDQINLDLNYTFQLNPTFAVQGRKIARYAIQNLGFDTLAVIAEKGSLGEPSAHAFLDEARKLDAQVVRYYVEELASQGYDITEYVQYFDPEVDTVFNYNIDAVYAPFTGNIAETLINNLLTSLEAMESNMTVLGSEEWETEDLNSRRLPESNIYFTKTFERNTGNTSISDFESAFRLRFDVTPNRFAYIGYDAANVVLETLKKIQNPAYLKEGFKQLKDYKGLIMNVNFDGTHINQNVKVKQLKRVE